jgi:hypothetical protein
MAGISLSIKKQLDLPTWEWLRFAPAASATGISCAASADNSRFHWQHGRYIYYLITAVSFWRYDTWTDSYQQLASPPIAPATWTRMKFCGSLGPEGLVLGAGAATMTIPSFYGNAYCGFDVRIIAGTGDGQRRIITGVAKPVTHDAGVSTAVGIPLGALWITDTAKAWTVNQYAGYTVRIHYGSGAGQVRRILYNTANTLYLSDVTVLPCDEFANVAVIAPAVSATAGVQSHYSIESCVATVDTAWDVQPDATSRFRIMSGQLILASTQATSFALIQRYDILTDTWFIQTVNSLIYQAVGTDGSIERCTENGSVWERGIATAGSGTTLTDAAKNWAVNEWVGRWVRIFSGTGRGALKEIVSNTATVLTWSGSVTAPDATSRYVISGFDAGVASAGGASTLTDSGKSWENNRWKNYELRITAGTGLGQSQAILSNNDTELTVIRPWATQPDATSTYEIVGDTDKLYLSQGGTAAIPIYNLKDNLATIGRRLDSGIARNACVSYAAEPPVAIASLSALGTTATVTTAAPHRLKVGWSVTVAKATDANYNGTYTIASVPSATTFTYTTAGAPAVHTLVGAQSTTTLCDASKNWANNEWAGYLVTMTTTAVAGATGLATGQAFQIASNTDTTLTFVAVGTAPINGVSRYVITPRSGCGALDSGIATGAGQTTAALVDTGKAWVTNIHAGKRVKFVGGAGQGQEATIISNTGTTLAHAGVTTASVAGSTSYLILDQAIRNAGFDLSWPFGVSDDSARGKYLISPRSGALSGFDLLDITTDRFDIIPVTPQTETLTISSMYAYDGGDRIYFTKEYTQRLYYLDLCTLTVHCAGLFPYVGGTTCLGNRMEIFETEDRLKFLWINRHSYAECFRTLLFY